jgi:hypothetical protein
VVIEAPRREAMCLLHEAPLSLMCNTCDELICQACAKEGPHNTAFHLLMTLDTAGKVRQGVLNTNLDGPVAKKSEVLGRKMNNLIVQIDKLREGSQFIQKDTKVYFENMIGSLKSTFQHETADFVGRIEYYEQEVREINGLISYFNVYLDPRRYFEFLVVYPRLKEKLEELEDRQHGNKWLNRRRQELRQQGGHLASRGPRI